MRIACSLSSSTNARLRLRSFRPFILKSHVRSRSKVDRIAALSPLPALLSGLPGSRLPDAVARALKPGPVAGGRAVVRLTFVGPTAERPLVSQLIKSLGADVNIIAGTIDEIAGKPYGSLVVAYGADAETLGKAERFFRENGLVTEVVGYVA